MKWLEDLKPCKAKAHKEGEEMELRDTIAIEAMRVLLAKSYDKPLSMAQADALFGIIPKDAYKYADEMLSVRGIDLRSMEDIMRSDIRGRSDGMARRRCSYIY